MSEPAHSQPAAYRWTISASDTDPFVNTAPFSPGLQNYYLWLESCDLPDPLQDGISAAELILVSTDALNEILAFQVGGGWLNNGDTTHLALATGSCPCGPVIAGTVLMLINTPGSLCIGGPMLGVDCSFSPSKWDIVGIGLDFGGGPCTELPIGACCLPTGVCVDGVDNPTCDFFGGVFQGAGTNCSSVPCVGVLGACCFADGSCNELTQFECESAGGFFQGFGSACNDSKCPPLGACCFPDGSCVNEIGQSACESAGGAFQGVGSTCDQANCSSLPGACCLPDGSCAEGYNVAQCAGIGGNFQGVGTTCTSSPCITLDSKPYGWGISASLVDPYVNTVPVAPGLQTSYLWLLCSSTDMGITSAKFSLVTTNPANQILNFNTMNGFLNAGNNTNLLLAVGGCPSGPVVAGAILMLMSGPGSLCINVAANGGEGTVDCLPTPTLHPMDWIGLGFGNTPCVEDYPCTNPTPLDPSSWGRIKSYYR